MSSKQYEYDGKSVELPMQAETILELIQLVIAEPMSPSQPARYTFDYEVVSINRCGITELRLLATSIGYPEEEPLLVAELSFDGEDRLYWMSVCHFPGRASLEPGYHKQRTYCDGMELLDGLAQLLTRCSACAYISCGRKYTFSINKLRQSFVRGAIRGEDPYLRMRNVSIMQPSSWRHLYDRVFGVLDFVKVAINQREGWVGRIDIDRPPVN